ncbi:uncharacterized protein LOC121262331 [Juglans microcarpa x Juglans regia]|uniref:uncharacterized protein LOC121262331 n=1 Tax=Juglans microcarpa x Juglans regia TaxID=2249226 RepID=UPI001B7DD79D|nr:uncharacterized protein LOC121262331 [Juglans microcarpa x Juglans regia]
MMIYYNTTSSRYPSRVLQNHTKNLIDLQSPSSSLPTYIYDILNIKSISTTNQLQTIPMESVASNSPSPDNHRPPLRFRPIQPIADRIARALRHHLRLLHRSDQSKFFVLGATGNVYIVTLSATPSCTCPDRTSPCKHILLVFIRVLGVSLDDACLRRKTLRPFQLNRLLGAPILSEALAGARVRERFHQIFFQSRQGSSQPIVEIEDGTTCPICLDEMGKCENVVTCGTCQNPIHEECLLRWKRSRGRRSATCVICRARWRDRADQAKYLNLAAYASQDDPPTAEGSGGCGG